MARHCEEGPLGRRRIARMASSPRQRERPADDDQAGAAAELRDLIRSARSVGALAPGEESKLLERAALGDRASQDRLVAANLERVVKVAATRGEQGLSALDLVQEGSIGLLEAVRNFAYSGESDFARFAEALIGAQMDAAIAAEVAAVREGELLVAAATDYERAELVMKRELHRDPTAPELAEKLEWTVDRTLYVARVVADARRRYDEEMLALIDPEAIDLDDDDDERADLDG